MIVSRPGRRRAALHTRAATRKALATWGALSGLSALLALFYGVQLHG